MRLFAVLAVLVYLFTAEAGDVHAAGRLHFVEVATSSGGVVGDGATVAWEESPGRVLVRGARGATRIVQEPADCSGDLTAVGGGYVLLACAREAGTDYVPRFDVVSIATGVTTTVVNRDEWRGAGSESPNFDSVGAHWLAGPYVGLHVDDTFFLNWRTNTTVVGFQDPFGPSAYLDLSFGRLGRRLCRPIERPFAAQDITETTPKYEPLSVWHHWALTTVHTGLDARLRLQHCGSRHRLDLHEGDAATLGDGWASWFTYRQVRDGVRALRLADQRIYTARIAQAADVRYSLAHTATALYLSATATGGTRILRATLPRLPRTRPANIHAPRTTRTAVTSGGP
jgi:hypothetical protein